jgi:hypothetical protein
MCLEAGGKTSIERRKTMMKKRIAAVLAALGILVFFLAPFSLAGQGKPCCHTGPGCFSAPAVQLDDGDVWVVEETTRLSKLTLAEGAAITAPEGNSLTLTVNGVETGGVLVDTYAVETIIAPGTYRGCVVLTVAEENIVTYAPAGPPGTPTVDFPFRQALYLGEEGVVAERSVLAAVLGKKRHPESIRNILIRSQGENFNGIFAADGTHEIKHAKIDLSGNGRSDFAGYGAAAMATGENTKLVLDRVKIVTDGVVRTAAIADQGASLIVKNSFLQTNNGVLPDDYMPTIDTAQMRSVPWMLSLSGNNRATNLLGTNTKATYINSYIGAEGWGVLSTDGCTTPTLTAINSTIAITGEDGYGSYGIGDATEYFYGCTFNVATYATISRGSHLYYGDSDPDRIAELNEELDLGLSPRELRRIRKRPTIVNSDRFGIMWHGGGTLDVSGGTIFNTGETTFLDKGQAIAISVDGSEGARLNPGNGVILQVMDDDDPGPVMPSMHNTGIYEEPAEPAEKEEDHDVTIADDTDALVTFSNIELTGDFYNSTRGGLVQGPFGPPGSVSRNLSITFMNTDITGVISAATAEHILPHIEYPIGWDEVEEAPFINEGHTEDYKYLGEVTNEPSEAINNGVIVLVDGGSTWTVTGTCHLTSLEVKEGAVITAMNGYDLTMRVDGVETDIAPGKYTGAIVLTTD